MEREPVYQALIRPPRIWGVSQAWLVIELLVPVIGFMLLKSFWPFVLIPIAHVIGMIGTAYDKRFIEVEMARAICHSPLRGVFGGRNAYIP